MKKIKWLTFVAMAACLYAYTVSASNPQTSQTQATTTSALPQVPKRSQAFICSFLANAKGYIASEADRKLSIDGCFKFGEFNFINKDQTLVRYKGPLKGKDSQEWYCNIRINEKDQAKWIWNCEAIAK